MEEASFSQLFPLFLLFPGSWEASFVSEDPRLKVHIWQPGMAYMHVLGHVHVLVGRVYRVVYTYPGR